MSGWGQLQECPPSLASMLPQLRPEEWSQQTVARRWSYARSVMEDPELEAEVEVVVEVEMMEVEVTVAMVSRCSLARCWVEATRRLPGWPGGWLTAVQVVGAVRVKPGTQEQVKEPGVFWHSCTQTQMVNIQ